MSSMRVRQWALRLLALAVAAVVIPACDQPTSINSGGVLWNQNAGIGTQPTGTGVFWVDPNQGTLPPIGIGTGGAELTYGIVDPTNFPASDPEAPHPVSTPTAMDAIAEATVEGACRNVYTQAFNINVGGGGQNFQGPQFYVGSSDIRGVARARAKHQALHNGGAPDPGGLAQRLDWASINTARIAPQEFEAAGSGLTAQQAGNLIASAAQGYIAGITQNAWGGAGFWSSGSSNYYNFTIFQLPSGQVP